MKKLISLMLVLVMAFAMVACAQPAATTEEPAAEEGAATEETAAPAEEVTMAMRSGNRGSGFLWASSKSPSL